MKNYNNIKYKQLNLEDFHLNLLIKFNRYQETNIVLYKQKDDYNYKSDHFIDQWDDEKKKVVTQSLKNCVKQKGIVIGAFLKDDLIGFASVEGQFFGSNNEYLELSFIHVSNEFRYKGIGRKLFNLCCVKANQKGAEKLYIAAHPSQETQAFYKSVGCTYAAEINPKIYEKEPLDIQLEITLSHL